MRCRSSDSGSANSSAGLFLIGIIVPVQIALVPLFIDYSSVNLLDTYQSMIIPLAGFALPMSIYLFSSFFEYIPRETYEAASLDGAGPYRIFGLITLPLSTNTVVTVVLVNSIFIWNDFIFANTFVLSEGLKTVPLGLQNYIGAMGKVDWTATFAAVCITITPLAARVPRPQQSDDPRPREWGHERVRKRPLDRL